MRDRNAKQDRPAEDVLVSFGPVTLAGILEIPNDPRGIVLFAHGSGSSRLSPRNQHVARDLREGGIATLLMDLLTPEEEDLDERTGRLRFDIELLTQRVIGATGWLAENPATRDLPIGYFGASTGAAAALSAAAQNPDPVAAIVSRGGRPDLAGDALEHVRAPTLLIVGELDLVVIEMNQTAMDRMTTECHLRIVPGATHLFEEPGTLDEVAALSRDWFATHLTGARHPVGHGT
jgi:dienelactone hydrolase